MFHGFVSYLDTAFTVMKHSLFSVMHAQKRSTLPYYSKESLRRMLEVVRDKHKLKRKCLQ